MKFAKTSKGTTPQTTEKQSKKKSSTPKRVIPQGASASQVQPEMSGPAMILPKQATPGTCGLENIFTPPQNVSTQKVGMRNKRGNVDDGMSSSSSASGFSTPNIFKKKKQSPPPKPTTAHVDDRLLNIQETLSTAVQQMNKNSERIAIACESMRDHIKTGTKYWKWVATYMQTKLLEKRNKSITTNMKMKTTTTLVMSMKPQKTMPTTSMTKTILVMKVWTITHRKLRTLMEMIDM